MEGGTGEQPTVSVSRWQSPHFLAGLITGVTTAVAFNPWDRALYLSVFHKRRFLHRGNFSGNLWQGSTVALVHRTVTGGLYFPLVEFYHPLARRLLRTTRRGAGAGGGGGGAGSSSNSGGAGGAGGAGGGGADAAIVTINFIAGNLAGATNGVATNPLNAVKYQQWVRQVDSFRATARTMLSANGLRPFMRGIGPTVARDSVFGGTFSASRVWLGRAFDLDDGAGVAGFGVSVGAGALACIVSSPFNYCRNMAYATPPGTVRAPTTLASLRMLAQETRRVQRDNSFARTALEGMVSKNSAANGSGAGVWTSLVYLQGRLRVGWGTARVALGMATGFELYSFIKRRVFGVEDEGAGGGSMAEDHA